MFLLTVAWRNLWRHRRRSLITASAMGLGMALCMFTIALTDGMYAQMFDVMVTQNLGHAQIHHPDYPAKKGLHDTVPGASALVGRLDQLPQVRGLTPRLFGFALAGGADKSSGVRLIGVQPAREEAVTHASKRVVGGRFLADDVAQEAVLGDELMDELKLDLGEQIVVIGQSAMGAMASDLYTIVGTVHTGSTAIDRGAVYLHQSDLQDFLDLPDQVHEIVVVGDDAELAPALAASIQGVTDPADPPLVRTWTEADPQAAQMLGMQDASKVIMLGIVFSVAALGVLNTMLMAVFERTRELGVMRALGLTPSQLLRLVLVEAVLLTTLSAAVGLVLGAALDWWVITEGINFAGADGKGMTYQGITLDPIIRGVFDPTGVVLTLVMMFGISVAAAIWPAIRAARLQPVDAMRHV